MTQATLMPATLRVALFGMSERTHGTFTQIFGNSRWRDCKLAGPETPDFAIVDVDGSASDGAWQAFRHEHPRLPALVLSAREQRLENARLLKKPLDVPTLRKAIDEIRIDLANGRVTSGSVERVSKRAATPAPAPAAEKPAPSGFARPLAAWLQRPSAAASPAAGRTDLAADTRAGAAATPPAPQRRASDRPSGAAEAPAAPVKPPLPFAPRRAGAKAPAMRGMDPELAERFCGNAADVAANDWAGIAKVIYDPRRHFQGMLERAMTAARTSGQSHAVTGLQQPLVVLGGRRLQIATSMNGHVLRSLCHLQFEPRSLGLALATASDLEQISNAPLVPADLLLWQVALWSGRGRLRRSLAVDVPVRLLRWPNFTRMIETPEAMRIAATISEAALTPLEIAARLRIPQRYVFSFLSAARAIGHLERVAPEPGAAPTDPDATYSPAMGMRRAASVAMRAPAAKRRGAPRPLLTGILSKLRSGS